MDKDKIYKLLNNVVLEIEEQQRKEISSSESPETIAYNINHLRDVKRLIYDLADNLKEIGFRHNLTDLKFK